MRNLSHWEVRDEESDSKVKIIRGRDLTIPEDVIYTVEAWYSIEKEELNKYFYLETLFALLFEKVNSKRNNCQ